MGIHVSQSDEAAERLKKQKATSTVSSFLISISIIGILTAILATLTILIPTNEVETIISYKAPPVDQDITNKPVIKKMQRQTPTPPAASSAVANVITTTAPTAVSIPDTNDFTSVESSDFGSSADFGMGFGDFSDSNSEAFTLFGSKANTGMAGHIYDMKKQPNNEPSDLYEKIKDTTHLIHYIHAYRDTDEAKKLVKEEYKQSELKKYFRSEEQLNFTFLVIGKTPADVGPEAFNAEKDIAPKTWLAVYEGVFAEAPRKPFRFMGRFDDTLIVYINDKVVFDGSYHEGYSDAFSDMDTGRPMPGTQGLKPAAYGPFINPKVNDRIRIVIGEIPGGFLGGGLFIEEKNVDTDPSKMTPFVTIPVEGEVKKILSEKEAELNLEDVPVFKFKN